MDLKLETETVRATARHASLRVKAIEWRKKRDEEEEEREEDYC